jgi:hypothetical protein
MHAYLSLSLLFLTILAQNEFFSQLANKLTKNLLLNHIY